MTLYVCTPASCAMYGCTPASCPMYMSRDQHEGCVHVYRTANPFRPACAQYIDFLADTLEGPAYAALLPPLPDLVQGFGVDPEVAFKVLLPPSRHVQMPPVLPDR